MSQFWYDEETARTMAAEVKRLGGRVACLACPSLYRQMMVRDSLLRYLSRRPPLACFVHLPFRH